MASLLHCVFLATLLWLPASALPQPKVGDRFGDWAFECVAIAEGKTACALTHAVVSKVDGQRIAQLSLGRNEMKKAIVLTAFLPLGIHLPSGVSGALDQGKPFSFVLETCYARSGCIATFVATPEFLMTLQASKQLSIGFVAADGLKQIALQVPLAGIGAGLKAAKLE
jgi:invasion protein IalB